MRAHTHTHSTLCTTAQVNYHKRYLGVWLLLTGGVATGKALPSLLDHVGVTCTLEVRGHLAVREAAIEEVWSWPDKNHSISPTH